ncbi:chaperone DnaJ-domain superfamily protein [Actinidia rufa]|uniref:Chaperone DnaJ-domain superfamily protein n=1 Tax=Actinidia rufa TaxID=165716 RepID=A0A7J0DD91_9ERIC|nr:chaperone DnaJ-domain superfamily protein [Actinidia rufa]
MTTTSHIWRSWKVLGFHFQNEEDSEKSGKVTSAGMYFLHFQVYRMDSTVNALAMAKDPEAAFFKKLEGLQPCEVSELKPGTHIFAVYGDNFFKTASYMIEAVCVKSYEDTTHKLKEIEAQILRKRTELRQFETEYRKALARFQEVTNRYSQEKQSISCADRMVAHVTVFGVCGLVSSIRTQWCNQKSILSTFERIQNSTVVVEGSSEVGEALGKVDELLKQRDTIHSSFTVTRSIVTSGTHVSNGSSSSSYSNKVPVEDFKDDSPGEDGSSDGKDKSSKKKWFNLNLKGSDKKSG